ncbi:MULTISPECIES: YXWGXW repeat-containing protein [Cupriavidus]|uniref:YXWGXW repeat-containing protein n=1 Tax=unclassified Cupriavidus TaxID=2640874 RepID=UPI00044D6738|nr:YXWGXW repeat-containing protein [Cupriavidus sp. SK-3]KDP83537.1 signal peptide protein [Cupriavidus sp. SK-3]
MKRQLLLALTTLAAGAALGLISPAQAQAYPSGYHGGPYMHPAPPPPRYEPRPAARPGQAWVPGHWTANGGRYDWRGGYWQHARPGQRYVPERWVQSPRGGWVMRPGYWVR